MQYLKTTQLVKHVRDKDWYEDKLDNLFSKVVRARDEKCLRCYSIYALECVHVATRDNFLGRWNEHNALTLCHKCHIGWAHRRPREFEAWVKEKYPSVWEEAEEVKQTVWQPNTDDYRSLYIELKARLKVLEATWN